MSVDQGRLSQYELHDLLESDHLSELWKAFDTQQRRYVHIKILHIPQPALNDFAPKFLQETQKLRALQHPHIAQVVDTQIVTNAQGNKACVVTEYLEGQLLSDFLQTTVHAGTFLDANELVKLLSALGGAIDYAHQQGVIHGAIQPTNILLDKQSTSQSAPGDAQLLGFGMQHFIPVQALPLEAVSYISPERAQGLNENLRSDIYSLGVLLYELSTGTLPFQGDTPEEVLAQHVQSPPTSPALINPHIRPALIAVILRCLSKEPAQRFPTALALVAAVARALQVSSKEFPSLVNMTPSMTPSVPYQPVPAHLDPRNSPTYFTPLPNAQPSGPYPVVPAPGTYPPAQVQSRNSGSMPMVQAQQAEANRNFALRNSQPYDFAETVRQTPAGNNAFPALAAKKAAWRPGPLYFFTVVVLVLILLGSLVGLFLINQHKIASPATPTKNSGPGNAFAGQAFFVSSGQLDPDTTRGTADRIQISLQNVPAPAAGKSYYFWLLSQNSNSSDIQPLLIYTATHGGQITATYQGDANHDNLLAIYNRLLVTEESADSPPDNPSLDAQTHRYAAEFSTVVSPEDSSGFSLLQHMQHLLEQDPKLHNAGLTGGLDIWLFRNTLKILETSGSIRDSQDPAFIQRQLVRILDYLDSSVYIQKTEHLPAGIPAVEIDPTIAKVAILNFDAQQEPPGYLKHIGNHLRAIIVAPGVTDDQKALASRINSAINNVQFWMDHVHLDTQKLLQLPPNQLTQPVGTQLLDDLFTQSNNALVGQTDPNTNQVKEGVIQIHDNLQRLATFDLTHCASATVPGCE